MPGPKQPNSLVRVAWTGNDACERVKTVPITAIPGQKPVVVMSFGSAFKPEASLPDLRAGDDLWIGVELEVTTDLTPKEAADNARGGGKPTGQPYDYAPAVVVELLLASDDAAAAPEKGLSIRIGDPERLKLSHEQHHGLFAFSRSFGVPSGGLPWKGLCCVNLVVSTSHKDARAGQVLLIGQNEFDGSVEGDMGALSVVRARPAPSRGSTAVDRDRRINSLPLSDDRWRVVSSVRLEGLRKNEQLLAEAVLHVDAKSAGAPGRIKTRMFLADQPDEGDPSGKTYAAESSTSSGHLTKANGSNCLPGAGQQTFRKLGVVQITRDLDRPVFLNLAAQAGNPTKNTKPGDLAITEAELKTTRFEPAQIG